MTEITSNPFSAEVVAAVTRHMNVDHAADSVVICQALGGQPEATAATMTGLDAEGIAFDVATPSGPATARIAWTEPVTERAQIRAEVAAMYHRACDQLGITPAAGEHTEGAS